MAVQYANTQFPLRVLLIVPFLVLLAASIVLAGAALMASGAAEEVGYPNSLPVYAGLLAAVPSALFGVAAGVVVWGRTLRAVVIRPLRLCFGLIPIGAAIALLVAYALFVGDPEHYKGEFNNATQEWNPRVPTAGSYLSLIAGVAMVFPMGALGITAKVLYLDALEGSRLKRPEGIDPIGVIMSGR